MAGEINDKNDKTIKMIKNKIDKKDEKFMVNILIRKIGFGLS
jgi:hypothetical protein